MKNAVIGHAGIFVMLLTLIYLMGCTAENKTETEGEFLLPVKAYADAMIQLGRDNYGTEESPLFASVLDRKSMQIDERIDTIKMSGVRQNDRSVFGANMIHDSEFFEILFALSTLTGEDKYGTEADKAFEFFFNQCQSEVTDLYCWGEHLYWNFFDEDCGYAPNFDYHETTVWPFWEKAYDVAPDAVWRFTLAEWDHQIHNKSTGDFSRHARYSRHETYSGFDFPRYAGQLMERWTYSYGRLENADRPGRSELRQYIKVMFERMKDNMAQSGSGLLIAGRSSKGDHNSVVWLTSNLELARCLEVAAPIMDQDLAQEMRDFAIKQDQDFLAAPHRLDSLGGGFAVTLHAETGLPRVRSMNKPYSSTWSSGYGYGTHAGVANTLYKRYISLRSMHPQIADRYEEMILQVGEMYLNSEPDLTTLLKPNEFQSVIQLMLHCHSLSRNPQFVDRAAFFARMGMALFLNDGSPLPKVTNRHEHYESITGGPAFMYQLLKLHQTLNP
ncbi:MAG: hypothetical protein HKN87_04675 [Saprospiraceae bacterium]|nr:hypothetical protein [Saprospiraceae bacterium]